jgi:hypothetical protein
MDDEFFVFWVDNFKSDFLDELHECKSKREQGTIVIEFWGRAFIRGASSPEIETVYNVAATKRIISDKKKNIIS